VKLERCDHATSSDVRREAEEEEYSLSNCEDGSAITYKLRMRQGYFIG